MEPLRVGVLISGSGSNLEAIVEACEAKKIDGRVAVVGSDRPGAKGLQRAERHHIPTFVVDYAAILRQYQRGDEGVFFPADCDKKDLLTKQRQFPPDMETADLIERFTPRLAAESRLLHELHPHRVDLLVLAGFMRKLTPYFIDRKNLDAPIPRIMNIHPSLLPSFPGTDGYGDTFRYGCKIGGCTVHFIDYGEDTGPIIGQRAFQIEADDTVESVKQKGLRLEWELYPHCIQLYAKGLLRVQKRLCRRNDGSRYERKTVVVG